MDFDLSRNGTLLRKYRGKGGYVVIPDGVTEIADEAFSSCRNITTIEFPNGLKKIGRWAFQFCTVTELILPDSLTELGHSCFFECDHLVKVRLPKNLKYLPEYCFQQCHSLTEIEIPESVQILEDNAFCVCESLEKVTLHEGLLEIGALVFAGCTALRDIAIPRSVTKIGVRAFDHCPNLTEAQTTTHRISFYTVLDAASPTSIKVGAMHIAHMGYEDEDVERILAEVEKYEVHCSSNSEKCGWYTDDRTERASSDTIRKITPEMILIKDGHFRGCVMEYRHSYWSYHTTDDRTELVLLTMDEEEGVLIEYTDHTTDNGDYSSRTYAYLVNIEE